MFIGGTYISDSVRSQAQLFLTAMMWGAAVCLAYDGLRILRRLPWHTPRWLYICEDIIFWIAEALMIYRLMFTYDSGAIRSYTMFGMITGMALYLWIFGKWLAPLAGRCINAILKAVGRFFKRIGRWTGRVCAVVFRPIRWILGYIGKFFCKKMRFCGKSINSFLNMLKKKRKAGKIKILRHKDQNTEERT